MEESYNSIRAIIGEFVGKKLLEITQHDQEYFERTGRSFIDLMFEDGDVLRFYVQDHGLCVNPDEDFEMARFGSV